MRGGACLVVKLSLEDYKIIEDMYTNGTSTKDIANVFGISPNTLITKIKNKSYYGQNFKKNCELCGKEFNCKRNQLKLRKFCSKKCLEYVNNRRGYEPPKLKMKKCKFCGKAFQYKNYNGGMEKEYCSHDCKCRMYQRLNPKEIVVKNCKHCKNQFQKRGNSHFCSNECKKEYLEVGKIRSRTLRKCKYCQKWKYGFKFNYCSDRCRKKASRITSELSRHKKYEIARRNGQFDADIDIYKLIERDGEQCYLCGDTVLFNLHYNDPKYPTIEHVLAIKNGGTHSWDNVKVACRECNTRKSTILVEEFMKGVD